MIDPNLRRIAAEQIEILGKQTLDFVAVLFGFTTVGTWNPHCFKRDLLRVRHAKHIVILGHEQLCRIPKGLIFGTPLWVRVAMRAGDWQIADFIV